jgi:hypothetical protein
MSHVLGSLGMYSGDGKPRKRLRLGAIVKQERTGKLWRVEAWHPMDIERYVMAIEVNEAHQVIGKKQRALTISQFEVIA